MIYRYWQHEETGCVVKLLFWKNPGKRYYRIKSTNLAKFMFKEGLGTVDLRRDID